MSLGRVLILGAGPAGLAAAHRLCDAGHDQVLVMERERQVGGLSATTDDAVGFLWDYGSHVYFSDSDWYDAWLNRWVAPQDWQTHQRQARVWLDGQMWPYPIQQHAEALECAVPTTKAPVPHGPVPFGWWLANEYGADLCRRFFAPYNEKVWGYPLDTLDALPIVNRIAPAAATPTAWGPNATFRYPTGGAGMVWRKAAAALGLRVLTNTAVVGINPATKHVSVRRWNGAFSEYRYDHLINTMPATVLLGLLPDATETEVAVSSGLRHSGLCAIGFGFEGTPPERLTGLHWWYDPDPQTPYYRGSVLSNYSPALAPPGCWSVLVEVCESPSRPVSNPWSLADQCLAALKLNGLVSGAPIAKWQRFVRYGYPTPRLDRNHWLARLAPALAERGIASVGRFGAWQYERGNMDHCVKQGQEAAERLLERAS